MYREVSKTLNYLEKNKEEIRVGRDIERIIALSFKNENQGAWQYDVLHKLVRDFVEFNGRASVSFEDWQQYLWDYAATQKGQIPEVDAVLVTTIHQVKGKEFKQVFLLDPDVRINSNKKGQTIEDERRLYYVGLTRAEELASVIKVPGSSSPFADELLNSTEFTRRRKGIIHKSWEQAISSLSERLRCEFMGLSDIWASSFARKKSKWFNRDRVQALLADLLVGAPLEFRLSDFKPQGEGFHTVDIYHNSLKLGSLSQATASEYQDTKKLQVEVGAVIQCWKDENDKYSTLDRYYAVLPKVIVIN